MLYPSHHLIPLRTKNGSIRAYTSIDHQDYERFGHLSWYETGTGYAARERQINGRRYRILLHRAILDLGHGDKRQVDHINQDGLDNRRENLRIVSNAENKQNKGMYSNNKSGYRGVHWHKRGRKWIAQYRLEGKNYYLGSFTSAKEAGEVARKARARVMPYA